MYTDSHAHFGSFNENELKNVVMRAVHAGVSQIIAVGGSKDENSAAIRASELLPSNIKAAIGYDRDCVGLQNNLSELEALISNNSVPIVAVGESGLDFHYDAETKVEQQTLFDLMLNLAGRHGLPIVVHSREADAAAMALLKKHVALWSGDGDRVGVVHCFTGNPHFAMQLLDLGFYISFSGIVSFKNANNVRESLKVVPDDRLLIETDSPYLAPVPYRGKKNEPGFLPKVAEVVAAVRGVRAEDIAVITESNAAHLFG